MEIRDLGRVLEIQANSYPPEILESEEAFAKRISLFPNGCKVVEEKGEITAYLICHPWKSGTIPSLSCSDLELPPTSDVLHIHDVAVSPSARGRGIASLLAEEASRLASAHVYQTITLVAVQEAHKFWQRHGYVDAELVDVSALAHYASGARYMKR